MKLLSSEKIKSDKLRSDNERLLRIGKLNREETLAAKRLNDILKIEKEEKSRIENELSVNSSAFKVKKSVILAEVESLENRRRDAMKPITDTRKEAEKILYNNLIESKKIKESIDILEEEKDKVCEYQESLIDREHEVIEIEEKLKIREIGIESAELEIKNSTESLSKKWVGLYNKVSTFNNEIVKRETDVENQKIANDNIRKSNSEESGRLKNERIVIKDTYLAIEQAKKHLKI